MKQYVYLITLSLITLTFSVKSSAQNQAKALLAGSRLTLGTASNDQFFAIRPFIGYQLHQRWLIGAEAGYASGNQKFEQPDPMLIAGIFRFRTERDWTAFRIGAWARYTFNPKSKIQVFIQPFAHFDQQEATEDYKFGSSQEVETDFIYLGLESGVAVKLGSRWQAIWHVLRYQITQDQTNDRSFDETSLFDPLIDVSVLYRF